MEKQKRSGKDKWGSGLEKAVSIGTPYDDVYRTLLNDCRQLMIPVVNEVFGTDYTGEEVIIPAPNEHFINRQDGEEAERVTDASFTIYGRITQKYHIECQSRPDSSMVVRMFEYDSQIALDDARVDGDSLNADFPCSAVLFLRHNKNTPDEMRVILRTRDGEAVSRIPVVKLQRYTLNDIMQKNLLLFIPFYIFSYEGSFEKLEQDEEQMEKVKTEYRRICEHLEGLCRIGKLSEFEKRVILEMSQKVLNNIADKYLSVREGVRTVMGGKVLEYEAKDILRKGIEQGIEQGIERGIKVLISAYCDEGFDKDKIVMMLVKYFSLTREQAEKYYIQFAG